MSSEIVAADNEEKVFRVEEILRATIAPLAAVIRNQNEAIQRILQPFAELFQTYSQATQDAPQVQVEVTNSLLDQGWFVTYEFTDRLFYSLRDLFHDGKHKEADDVMAEFTRRQVSEVEAALAVRFPERIHIFADAFEAHKNGKYTLSIPVFFTQAEGVGCEVLGGSRQFFPIKARKNALAKSLDNFRLMGEPYPLSGVMKAMLDQLLAASSLAEDTDARNCRPVTDPRHGSLNRHGVLHGHDKNYDTEINSLRCVLLLRYLLDLAEILHEDIPNKTVEWNRILQGVEVK